MYSEDGIAIFSLGNSGLSEIFLIAENQFALKINLL